MSMESATKFYETMEKDTDLQKKISAMKDKSEIESLVQGVLGYDFSQEEMQKVIFDKNPELSDEEMEAVVGGRLDLDSVAIGAIAGITGAGIVVLGGFGVFLSGSAAAA